MKEEKEIAIMAVLAAGRGGGVQGWLLYIKKKRGLLNLYLFNRIVEVLVKIS